MFSQSDLSVSCTFQWRFQKEYARVLMDCSVVLIVEERREGAAQIYGSIFLIGHL